MIRTEFVPDDRAFVVLVETSKPTAAGDWQRIFDELDHAMDEIESKVSDHRIHYFLIRLHVEGFDTEREEDEKHRFTLYDPWDSYNPDFWRAVLAEPTTRPRVEQWVSRYAKTLKCAEEARRSTASLWEDQTTQFGEPLLLLLAAMDVTFLARYIEFIEIWDLSHGASIIDAMAALLERHGKRPETSVLAEIYAHFDF